MPTLSLSPPSLPPSLPPSSLPPSFLLVQVKVSTITNQNWELGPGHHRGRMLATNGSYLAYTLEGRSGYVLRLIHQESNSRALLKGFVGSIKDVMFAHGSSNMLAVLDQGGNLYVWDLDLVAKDIAKAQSYPLNELLAIPVWGKCEMDGGEGKR